jgi:hypothetical protein
MLMKSLAVTYSPSIPAAVPGPKVDRDAVDKSVGTVLPDEVKRPPVLD